MSTVAGSVQTLLGRLGLTLHSSQEEILERKQSGELGFWEGWVAQNGPGPESEYYRKFMMDMGDIRDESFFANRICLDVGCGPMGSLSWLRNARAAIGLDPLADSYMNFGIANQSMVYLAASA